MDFEIFIGIVCIIFLWKILKYLLYLLNIFLVFLSFIENVVEVNVYKVIVDLFLVGGEIIGISLDWFLFYMIMYLGI